MGQRRRVSGGLLARLSVSAAAVAVFVWPAPAEASTLHVDVNGTRVDVKNPATVSDAIRAAGIRLRDGVMRSAGTGQPLTQRVDKPVLLRDGQPVNQLASVKNGTRIRVMNGEDFVEPTVDRVDDLWAPGFPEVEFEIWQAPKAGKVRRSIGVYSGEAAAEEVIEPAVAAAPLAAPVVLLSFDDGPDGRWTPQVLQILRERNVKAVFCVVGVQIEQYPQLVKQIFDEGHVLCDHSNNHDMAMPSKPDPYVAAQIDNPFNQIRDITGQPPRYYRAPGGALSPFIIARAHQLGMRVLGWSVDPADYRKPGAEAIQNRIVLNIHGGGVALLHDGGGDRSQTVAQLPGLIDRLRGAGYSIGVP